MVTVSAMNTLKRLTALVALATFLGLSIAEASHYHATVQAANHCAVCQIAHKAPALVSGAAQVRPGVTVTHIQTVATVPSYLLVVFVAHGLSPPFSNS